MQQDSNFVFYRYEFLTIFVFYRYEFLTEKDIYFGVYKRTIGGEKKQKKSDMIEVVKMEKIDSQLVPGNGAITCTEPGTC